MTNCAYFFARISFLITLSGCVSFSGEHLEEPNASWLSGQERIRLPARKTLRPRFQRNLSNSWQSDLAPRERASVLLDPQNNRIFATISSGRVVSLDGNGRENFTYETNTEVDATPVFHRSSNTLFIAALDGSIHAIDATEGTRRYRAEVGHPLAEEPMLVDNILFCIGDDDTLIAVDSADGHIVWTYERPSREAITVTGHAGIALYEGRIIAAFDDGIIASIRASDGGVGWELNTTTDIENTTSPLRLFDIDTTPVIHQNKIWIASFSGGLYQIDPRNGTVLWHNSTYMGIVSIRATELGLLLSSADLGVHLWDPESHATIWSRANERGAPGRPAIIDGLIVYGESQGALLALNLDDGSEVTRYESGTGFVAEPRVAGGMLVTVSNGGRLFAFDILSSISN